MITKKYNYWCNMVLASMCSISLCAYAKEVSTNTAQSEQGDLVIDHISCTLADGRKLLVHQDPKDQSNYPWRATIGQGVSSIKLQNGSYRYVEDGHIKMNYQFVRGRLKYHIRFDYNSFREELSKGYIIIRNQSGIVSRIQCKTTPKFWVD